MYMSPCLFQFYDLPHSSYLDKSIRELNVGTFENIATVSIIKDS